VSSDSDITDVSASEEEKRKPRLGYVPINQMALLRDASMRIREAFGHPAYHVGSSLTRPDWRDVDVRLILADDEFDALFKDRPQEFWSLLCLSITEYLSRVSRLPVDFQIQRQTEANAKYGKGHYRNPLGLSGLPNLYAGGWA